MTAARHRSKSAAASGLERALGRRARKPRPRRAAISRRSRSCPGAERSACETAYVRWVRASPSAPRCAGIRRRLLVGRCRLVETLGTFVVVRDQRPVRVAVGRERRRARLRCGCAVGGEGLAATVRRRPRAEVRGGSASCPSRGSSTRPRTSSAITPSSSSSPRSTTGQQACVRNGCR